MVKYILIIYYIQEFINFDYLLYTIIINVLIYFYYLS